MNHATRGVPRVGSASAISTRLSDSTAVKTRASTYAQGWVQLRSHGLSSCVTTQCTRQGFSPRGPALLCCLWPRSRVKEASGSLNVCCNNNLRKSPQAELCWRSIPRHVWTRRCKRTHQRSGLLYIRMYKQDLRREAVVVRHGSPQEVSHTRLPTRCPGDTIVIWFT